MQDMFKVESWGIVMFPIMFIFGEFWGMLTVSWDVFVQLWLSLHNGGAPRLKWKNVSWFH